MTLRASFLLALLSPLVAAPTARAAMAECSDATGSCSVANDGESSISCACEGDSSGGSGTGGTMDENVWAGLSEAELEEVCREELASFCGDPPPPVGGVTCTTDLGSCTVNNDGFDSVSCSCDGGAGDGGTGGGNAWAGLSEEELMDVCLEQVDSFCDFEETQGEGTSTGGPATSGSSTSEGGDPGSADEDDGQGQANTGASGNGTNPGDGVDSAGTSGGGNEANSVGGAGDGAGGSESVGDSLVVDENEGSSGGPSCSVGPERGAGAGWMLAVLGLWGLRRRRAAR